MLISKLAEPKIDHTADLDVFHIRGLNMITLVIVSIFLGTLVYFRINLFLPLILIFSFDWPRLPLLLVGGEVLVRNHSLSLRKESFGINREVPFEVIKEVVILRSKDAPCSLTINLKPKQFRYWLGPFPIENAEACAALIAERAGCSVSTTEYSWFQWSGRETRGMLFLIGFFAVLIALAVLLILSLQAQLN